MPNSESANSEAYQGLQHQLVNAGVALGCILGSVSLALLAGTLFIRLRTRLNLKALPVWGIVALFTSLFLYGLFESVINGMGVSEETRADDFVLFSGKIVAWLFRLSGNCAFFYVAYKLLHTSLEYCTGAVKPASWLKLAHWIIFGILVAVSIANWGLYTNYGVVSGKWLYYEASDLDLRRAWLKWAKMEEAAYIVRWVASFELVVWFAISAMKTLQKREHFRVTSFFLLGGSVIFFALNMMWAIYMIRRVQNNGSQVGSANIVAVVESVFFLCTYIGIMPFCLRWGVIFQDHQEVHDLENWSQPPTQQNWNQPPPQTFLAEAEAKPAPFEADSRSYGDAKPGIYIAEADASRTIVEMDGSKAVFEADAGTPRAQELSSEEPREDQKFLYHN